MDKYFVNLDTIVYYYTPNGACMKNPCWNGYEQYGMKSKGGKKVPNCIPKENKDIMQNLSFQNYSNQKDISEAKLDLASYLVTSGIDIEKFNEGVQIISEWGWNPFKSFGTSAATGAGAMLGSALGPAGMALGGMAGNAAGQLASKGVGSLMKGAMVQPITPVYQQAVQAVGSLSQMLSSPDMAQMPQVAALKQNVDQVQQSLQGMQQEIPPIDQQRNAELDQKLQAGGGLGGKLRSAQQGTWSNWLGQKIQNIPALNKDMGLRRAMAQGMDAMNAWAEKNPKKASLLNMGATVAGGVAGAMGAGAAMGSPQSVPAGGPVPGPEQSTSYSYNDGGVQTYAQPSQQIIANQPYAGHTGWQDPRAYR